MQNKNKQTEEELLEEVTSSEYKYALKSDLTQVFSLLGYDAIKIIIIVYFY